MIKTIFTGFVLGLILILFVPATLILASWNAVPGDSTYAIKVGLEKTILGITPSDNLKTSLEIKYTERRFTEVEKLIEVKTNNTSKANTKFIDESLINLTNQAIASKNSLQKIQSVEEKTVQREALIATLESISVKIEEKKQVSVPTVTSNITTIKPSPKLTSTPTLMPTSTSAPIPTAAPTSIENIQPIINPPSLDNTQDVINEIIDELKSEASTQSNSDNNKDDRPSPKKDKNNSSNEDSADKDYKNNKENRDNKNDSDHRP